jgi:hypothetical protein
MESIMAYIQVICTDELYIVNVLRVRRRSRRHSGSFAIKAPAFPNPA